MIQSTITSIGSTHQLVNTVQNVVNMVNGTAERGVNNILKTQKMRNKCYQQELKHKSLNFFSGYKSL